MARSVDQESVAFENSYSQLPSGRSNPGCEEPLGEARQSNQKQRNMRVDSVWFPRREWVRQGKQVDSRDNFSGLQEYRSCLVSNIWPGAEEAE